SKLETVRTELVAAQQQSSIAYKLEYYERYQKQLMEFEELTLKHESSRWNHYYLDTLKEWIQTATDQQKRLKFQAQNQEPVTSNIYRPGEPLSPEFDKKIFIGREDLKEELQHKILSSPTMPMFLINGQRRVGKTSLLKFLPEILGPRFKMAYMDLQPIGCIFEWLTGLQKEFDRVLGITSTPLPDALAEDWVKTWKLLQGHMEEAMQNMESKVILAFDEYEKLHHHLKQRPEAAESLFSAMRSFSQHQDKIVFLFVGAAMFSELKAPNWSNYFVQAIRLKVDYLDQTSTYQLIAAGGLEYPQDVLEMIYHLTQGHPTLVQKICRELVDIANRSHRKQMTMEDLQGVLDTHIYVPDNGVTEVFWGQFCASGTMKATVKQIIAGETPGDFRAAFTLSQHGYVSKHIDGNKMRVPIFEEWVKKFGDVVG
ncbi:MAG: ATP-binding protein, partial [bacterium]|nr:ATP-binding protein [bacterium]